MALLIAVLLIGIGRVSAQAITEGFEDVTTLPAAGWAQQNLSSPVGTVPTWFQGDAVSWPAQAGPANSWIGVNFNSVTGGNTISNWLFTPNRTLNNGDIIRFWTRTTTTAVFADRLEVRLSTAGASNNDHRRRASPRYSDDGDIYTARRDMLYGFIGQ